MRLCTLSIHMGIYIGGLKCGPPIYRFGHTELQASQLGHCKLFGSTAGKLQAPGRVHSRGALVARTACSADREPVSQIQALASWKPPAQVPHHSTNEKPGPKNQQVPQKPSDPEIRKPKPRNPSQYKPRAKATSRFNRETLYGPQVLQICGGRAQPLHFVRNGFLPRSVSLTIRNGPSPVAASLFGQKASLAQGLH